MIHELQDVISWLLEQMPVKGFAISFEQPTQQWAARLQKATVNVFLYDIRDNPVLQPRTFTRIDNGMDREHKVVEKRTPLRMDCFYLITAWGIDDKKAMTEQMLLSGCILTLPRFPLLNPDRIKHVKDIKKEAFDQLDARLKNKGINTIKQEIWARLAGHDVLPNPAEIWSSLATPIRPSLSYVVNLPMDPWKPEEYDEVLVPMQQLGQTEWQALENDLMPTSDYHKRNGGSVHKQPSLKTIVHGMVDDRRSEENKRRYPVKVVLIDPKDTSKKRFAQTDNYGRFVFTNPPQGTYTLELWTQAGKPYDKICDVDVMPLKIDDKKKPDLPDPIKNFKPVVDPDPAP